MSSNSEKQAVSLLSAAWALVQKKPDINASQIYLYIPLPGNPDTFYDIQLVGKYKAPRKQV